jgi:YfiR/HmsC-like
MLASAALLTAQAVTQPALKAAFLFNFGKFVEWPTDAVPAGPLTVCVLDDAAVDESLTQLVNDAPTGSRQMVLLKGARNRSLRLCHLLYLGDPDPTRSMAALDELKGAPVLTVGDGEQFARRGGVIGLFVEDGRMRFAINADAAQRAGLRLSSRLLNLAKIVKEGRHGQS